MSLRTDILTLMKPHGSITRKELYLNLDHIDKTSIRGRLSELVKANKIIKTHKDTFSLIPYND